jgi:GLPGLI family protein
MDVSTDNPDMQMAIGMMQGSTLDVYFKDKNTRSEMKMGAMMTVTSISNETSGQVLMLMSGMMGKNAILTTLQELEQANLDKPVYEVQLIDEKKTIEGYTCKKAILTDEKGNETVFWYTEEIDVSKKGQNYLNENIPGFPMMFEINNNGMKMTMTVTKLEKKLDKKTDVLFDMTVPEGFTMMSQEQLKAMGM